MLTSGHFLWVGTLKFLVGITTTLFSLAYISASALTLPGVGRNVEASSDHPGDVNEAVLHKTGFIKEHENSTMEEVRSRMKDFTPENMQTLGLDPKFYNQIMLSGVRAECQSIDNPRAKAPAAAFFIGEVASNSIISVGHLAIDKKNRNRLQVVAKMRDKKVNTHPPCTAVPFAKITEEKPTKYPIRSDRYVLGTNKILPQIDADWGEYELARPIPLRTSIRPDLDQSDVTSTTPFYLIALRPRDGDRLGLTAKSPIVIEKANLRGLAPTESGVHQYHFNADFFDRMSGGIFVRVNKNGQLVASAMLVGGTLSPEIPETWNPKNSANAISFEKPFWTRLEAARRAQ